MKCCITSHLSLQGLIIETSLIINKPYEKKYFFIAIRLAWKCEFPGFQYIWDKALVPMYFLLEDLSIPHLRLEARKVV
jgi:hypothetical protein